MGAISYDPPGAAVETPPDAVALKQAVLDLPRDYWTEGRGSGTLSCQSPRGKVHFLVLPNLELGRIYLKYILHGDEGTETWLSMHDREQLSDNVECEEEWFAAAGLFLPPELAWKAIEHFLETRQLSPEITWVTPADLPDTANW